MNLQPHCQALAAPGRLIRVLGHGPIASLWKILGNLSGETHVLTAEIAEAAEASEKPVSQGWNTENSALSAYSAVKMMWTSERLQGINFIEVSL
jgi:hypothetical protein